jgi:hypothetical protein
MKRYIFGVVAIVVLMIVIIVALVRSGPDDSSEPVRSNDVVLREYADTVTFTATNGVVAAEERRAIKITVSAEARVIEVLEGYNERVIRRERLGNSHGAFEAFLLGLEGANFTKAREVEANALTVCPTGRQYYFAAQNGSQQFVDTWTTSCSRDAGTFSGDRRLTEQLFREQIPNYRDVTRGVNL